MTSEFEHQTFEREVAARLRSEGYDVVIEPNRDELPFDLHGYMPDLIARKQGGDNLIVEIKKTAKQLSFDRYQEIAEAVAQHQGWRFILVTSEDTQKDIEPLWLQNSTVKQLISTRLQSADKLISTGEYEAAFLLLWSALEALLRKRAIDVSMPVDRLPTLSVVKHLYSNGELSIEQFDLLSKLQQTRNALIHGASAAQVNSDTIFLRSLLLALEAE